MVLQDTWLFTGTIRDNIALRREAPRASEVNCRRRAAHVDHSCGPRRGYDTVVDEDAPTSRPARSSSSRSLGRSSRTPTILILDEQRAASNYAHRGPHPTGDGPLAPRPDELRHRSPALDHPQRGHDRRHGRPVGSSRQGSHAELNARQVLRGCARSRPSGDGLTGAARGGPRSRGVSGQLLTRPVRRGASGLPGCSCTTGGFWFRSSPAPLLSQRALQ